MTSVLLLLLFLPLLLVSVALHEYAHARTADWQGDPTPASDGRLTLNPFRHLDLMGSFLVPVALWLMPTRFIVGWARPVRVDPSRYRNPRAGDIAVSLAGVATNFALAVLLVPVLALLVALGAGAAPGALGGAGAAGLASQPWPDLLLAAARLGLWFNLLLGVFNLLPIPPLDGSHVVYHMLPKAVGDAYRSAGRYGMLILLAVVFLVPEALGVVLAPVDLLQDLALRMAGLRGGGP